MTGFTLIPTLTQTNAGATSKPDNGLKVLSDGTLAKYYLPNNLALYPVNNRFQGHREVIKFNLPLHNVLALCASNYYNLRTYESLLLTDEISSVYPLDSEIANIYHIYAQQRFREWCILTSGTSLVSWFL